MPLPTVTLCHTPVTTVSFEHALPRCANAAPRLLHDPVKMLPLSLLSSLCVSPNLVLCCTDHLQDGWCRACVCNCLSLSLFSLPLSPPSCAPCLGATSSSPETLTGLSSGEWGGLCSALAVSIADVHAAAYFELSLSFSLFVVSPTFSEATRGATLALCF